MLKNISVLILLLFSITFQAQENNQTITLSEFINQQKEKNESLKTYDKVNVMVNDLLIENHSEYLIDPKNIIRIEILVIDPKKNTNNVIPSIIIGTRKK